MWCKPGLYFAPPLHPHTPPIPAQSIHAFFTITLWGQHVQNFLKTFHPCPIHSHWVDSSEVLYNSTRFAWRRSALPEVNIGEIIIHERIDSGWMYWTTLFQRLPVTHALQRFFPISKTKFWWTSVKCFHDNNRVHFVSVSRPCSIIVGSGTITQWLWQSNLQFCWDGGLLCRENVVCLWIT